MTLSAVRLVFAARPAAAMALALFLPLGIGTAHAGTVEAATSGAIHTPSSAEGSIGNQIQYTDQNDTGVLNQTSTSGSIAHTYSGTTSDGLYGSDSYQSYASASLGTLHAYSGVNIISTAGPTAGWIAGDAMTYASASFSDSGIAYDPAYPMGAYLTATLAVHIDWAVGYGNTGFGMGLAQANFGLAYGGGTVGVEIYSRSDSSTNPNGTTDSSLQVQLINGSTINFSGTLDTQAGASFNNGYVNPGQTVTDYATSDAANTTNAAHFYITSASPTFSVIGEDGHNYSVPAAVPEPQTWGLMLAGLAVLGCIARRRRSQA